MYKTDLPDLGNMSLPPDEALDWLVLDDKEFAEKLSQNYSWGKNTNTGNVIQNQVDDLEHLTQKFKSFTQKTSDYEEWKFNCVLNYFKLLKITCPSIWAIKTRTKLNLKYMRYLCNNFTQGAEVDVSGGESGTQMDCMVDVKLDPIKFSEGFERLLNHGNCKDSDDDSDSGSGILDVPKNL